VSFLRSALCRHRAGGLAILLIVAVGGGFPACAHPAPDGFADLAARLLPAVVNVATIQTVSGDSKGEGEGATPTLPEFPPGSPFNDLFKKFFRNRSQSGHPEADTRHESSLGSGFIIDPAGYIVTNNHVVSDADSITVTLHDNTVLKATLVGRDTKTDIAVLKVHAKIPLTAVQWGDSDKARIGDWVMAIGNPFGLGGTVTAGILSARQRNINAGPYDDFLQTDASINRGNSGGPMFNMDGRVIGINTAIYSPSGGSIGIGFAIPSALARIVVADLIDSPDHKVHRGWLGVRIQDVTAEIAESLGLAKPEGALIASVTPKGPAEAAGLEPGDVVLTFDGKAVTDMRHLPQFVALTPVDKTVAVTVWRKRKALTLQVKVGRLVDAVQQVSAGGESGKAAPPSEIPTVTTLGLTLATVTPALQQKYALAEDAKGAVVVGVAPASPAADKGMRAGDVITEAAQEDVKTASDVGTRVAAARKEGHRSILLLVERLGDLRFVALRLDRG
jgi:serine protease Do